MKDQDGYKQDPTWLKRTGGFARDMTLRDHFAGLAMQATVQAWIIGKIYPPTDMDVANNAYALADAMLEERAK
jgi:hypothetical protein